MKLADVSHWVFDMDGTLTVAVHDFAYIRRELGIPPEHDILHHLAALPAAEARRKHHWLLEHERALACAARPAEGAVELVRTLHRQGRQLGILTRNSHELARLTLATIGLADCFPPEAILGRDEAPPKPDPGGLLQLAAHWKVTPGQMVMVGDYLFDLSCARAAGVRSILVNQTENAWPELTDLFTADCAGLLSWFRA